MIHDKSLERQINRDTGLAHNPFFETFGVSSGQSALREDRTEACPDCNHSSLPFVGAGCKSCGGPGWVTKSHLAKIVAWNESHSQETDLTLCKSVVR